jgi:uncharacterized membrane protein YkgB
VSSPGATSSLDRALLPVFGAVERIAPTFLRVALGVILLWIALLKFHDPAPVIGLLQASFLFRFLASSAFVYGLGVLEVLAALLLFFNVAVRYVGLLVALLFVGTLAIFLTAPAVAYSPGFPFLSLAGQFLLKDLGLMAGALTVSALDWQHRTAGADGTNGALRAEMADLRRRLERLERAPSASS